MKRLRIGSDFILRLALANKGLIFLFLFVLSLIIAFYNIIVPAIIIGTMAIIGSFSTSYKRVFRVPPAIELVTFTTIFVSIGYGPAVGIIYAVIVTICAEIFTNALDIFIISFVPSRMAVAALAGILYGAFDGNIILTGFVCSIIYNILAQPFYLFLSDVQMRAKAVFFIFLNVGSNLIIFAILGKPLAYIMGI